MTMEAANLCPVCGKPAVPDAPQGLCPECLMKSGFDTRGPGAPRDAGRGFEPPSIAQVARLFPQLEILELLGHGGMGAVYKARQRGLDRFVALKILPPQIARDPGFAERFNREARALARLNHPNIVTVYDFGQAVDIPYFLMEYVEGWSLRQVVQAGKLSPADTLNVVMQICEALQFAHGEGVVHRDIKPENILIDQKGRVKIADFGIAKVLDQSARDISLTGAQDQVGTAPYMAPEQIENPQTVDHRADIFSLGVVFYELLTGELPLGKFPPPSQKVQVDVRLDEVVLHTLEKEPGRRYQRASEVKTDVESIAATPPAGLPPVLEAPPPPAPAPPRNVSTGVSLAVVAGVVGMAVLLVFMVAGALWFVQVRRSEPSRPAKVLTSSNDLWAALNSDQRVVMQWIDHRFQEFDETRSFESWSSGKRAELEKHLIELLNAPRVGSKGPRSDEYYQVINTLAALHSSAGMPTLRSLAFEHADKILRSEISNRRRWMATRALGRVGDPAVVPDLIHLLYHNHAYVRWWAQISLVQLTGQNFGGDWQAWGRWWNRQHGVPAYHPEPVLWWKGQAQPDRLAENLAQGDRRFVEGIKSRAPAEPEPQELEESQGNSDSATAGGKRTAK